MECATIEQIAKEYLKCPTCDWTYSLIMMKHICNVILPCAQKPSTKYKEIDYKPRPGETPAVVDCDKCETARKIKTTARKATCPQCEYTGWYIHDETRLCPACQAQASAITPAAPKPKPKKAPKERTEKAPPQRLDLHLVLDKKGFPGLGGECTKIIVNGWTRAAVYDNGIPSISFARGIEQFSSKVEFYTETMKSLAEFLALIREEFDVRWQVSPDSLDKIWLIHLDHKYGLGGIMEW